MGGGWIGKTKAKMAEIVDAAEALAELRELALFSGQNPDVGEAFRYLINEGTAVLQIDHIATEPTGDTICRYKLAETLKVCLTAIRARNLEAADIQ